MWKIQFNEYVKFNNVKESIKKIKYLRKTEQKESYEYGNKVEQMVGKILNDGQLEVKQLPPQMDCGFGADLQVSYMKDNKNFSFYADITTYRPKAEGLKFFTAKGELASNYNEAFCYETEYFNLYIGIKEKHGNWFFYEKPVLVLYVDRFIPCTGLSVSHINNISHLLISLNEMLHEQGYGARASKKVIPNLNRFRVERYAIDAKEEDTPEAWGRFIYRVIEKGCSNGTN